MLNMFVWRSNVNPLFWCNLAAFNLYFSDNPCGGTYNTLTGSFQSPNFPGDYPPYSNCTYHIEVPYATSLTVSSTTFRLGRSGDVLMYYADDPDVGTPSSGRLAGFGIRRPLVFYTDSLWFRFVSDHENAAGGFNLTWEASCRFSFVLFLENHRFC